MRTRKITFLTIILTLLLAIGLTNSALAQPAEVKEALENTRESVEELATAKDENSPFDISLRIKTFQDVIDLAISEAEDVKIQLLSLKLDDSELNNWREEKVEKLNEILGFYEARKTYTEENKSDIDLDAIQVLATDFKNWRSTNSLPIIEEVRSFLFINKENIVLEIANKRWNKINKDLEILENAGLSNMAELWSLLAKARTLINFAEQNNNDAHKYFYDRYIKIAPKASNINATGTQQFHQQEILLDTSLNEGQEELSIRDLVKESLNNVRGAYQVFIEMSGVVRTLLK